MANGECCISTPLPPPSHQIRGFWALGSPKATGRTQLKQRQARELIDTVITIIAFSKHSVSRCITCISCANMPWGVETHRYLTLRPSTHNRFGVLWFSHYGTLYSEEGSKIHTSVNEVSRESRHPSTSSPIHLVRSNPWEPSSGPTVPPVPGVPRHPDCRRHSRSAWHWSGGSASW